LRDAHPVPDESFQEIGEKLVQAANLSDSQRKDVSDRLAKMIDYAIKRQDWYEDQRNRALSLGVALLGLASFLVGGLLNVQAGSMCYFRVFGCLTLLSIVATAGAIILEYGIGATESYTHRSLAGIRSWFFAYVVNQTVTEAALDDIKKRAANRSILVDAWKNFVTGWLEYQRNPTGFVAEDLQQVFILYLFQAMRRSSLRRMTNAAKYGAMVIAFFLTATIITAALRI
jgi:hypothetical protein